MISASKTQIKNHKGVTLVEFGIVLSLIAVFMIFMYPKIRQSITQNKINQEVDRVQTLQNKLTPWVLTMADTSQATTAIIAQQGTLTPSEWHTGSVYSNSFDTTITFAPTKFKVDNDGYSIIYNNISSDVCADFVAQTAATFTRVVVGGTTVKTTYSAQIDRGNLATACAAGGNISFDTSRQN